MQSFVKNGLSQKSTWVGIIGILFYIIYFDDISFFIHNLTHSNKTLDIFLSWSSNLTIAGVVGFLAAFKNFKNGK